eukprot:scaffold4611_cov45-Cyclotella_meneghiniana.AAC.5
MAGSKDKPPPKQGSWTSPRRRQQQQQQQGQAPPQGQAQQQGQAQHDIAYAFEILENCANVWEQGWHYRRGQMISKRKTS